MTHTMTHRDTHHARKKSHGAAAATASRVVSEFLWAAFRKANAFGLRLAQVDRPRRRERDALVPRRAWALHFFFGGPPPPSLRRASNPPPVV